ncbi:inositol phosphatase [Aliarcobacter trophiarum]|nr:inositol phosphatase [Aliarcobacter trophiarum]
MILKNIKKRVIKANIEILDYIEKSLKKEDFKYTKQIGFGGDETLKIDKIFEDIFIKNLKDYGNIFSEECGFLDFKKELTFIIDPLDGSNNFFSNIPYFGTSVALKKDGKIIAGFVANLANKTLVYKILNKKIKYISLLRDKKIIKVENGSSKVAVFERGYKYPNICKILNDKEMKFRVLGATALSLANARDFTFVLFKGNLREFDIDAGLFISNDLYIKKDEDMVFITKYKEVFSSFNEIIKQF